MRSMSVLKRRRQLGAHGDVLVRPVGHDPVRGVDDGLPLPLEPLCAPVGDAERAGRTALGVGDAFHRALRGEAFSPKASLSSPIDIGACVRIRLSRR